MLYIALSFWFCYSGEETRKYVRHFKHMAQGPEAAHQGFLPNLRANGEKTIKMLTRIVYFRLLYPLLCSRPHQGLPPRLQRLSTPKEAGVRSQDSWFEVCPWSKQQAGTCCLPPPLPPPSPARVRCQGHWKDDWLFIFGRQDLLGLTSSSPTELLPTCKQ